MTRKSVWFIVFLLIGIFLFLKYVMPYVLPFALGAFLAFLLDPLVSFLTKRTRITRGWGGFHIDTPHGSRA
jgi:predicted PurR-regulated permease PerM